MGEITTLIDTLGGGTVVAARVTELSGEPVDRENVYKWKSHDHVPHRWRPWVRALCIQVGVEVPASIQDPTIEAA